MVLEWCFVRTKNVHGPSIIKILTWPRSHVHGHPCVSTRFFHFLKRSTSLESPAESVGNSRWPPVSRHDDYWTSTSSVKKSCEVGPPPSKGRIPEHDVVAAGHQKQLLLVASVDNVAHPSERQMLSTPCQVVGEDKKMHLTW